MIRRISLVFVSALAAGCASPHVRPDAMTAPQHERAAAGHLTKADEAEREYDPDDRPSLPCLLLGMRGGDRCIGKMHNQTSDYHEAAERERKRAAEHAAAAAHLRVEEERACHGMSDDEAADGPLAGGLHPFAAQPLIDYDDQATVFGVVMAFEVEPPNADRLQALVECHRARVANRGIPSQAHECPLDDASLAAMVIITPRGTLLELRSEDPVVARRAWERAKRAARLSRPHAPKPATITSPPRGS